MLDLDSDLFFGADFFGENEEPKLSLKEGELREVAVLFADIKGFTNISTRFAPEVIHDKMDEIMKIFSRSINFYGGFVDKYIGDGVMALFGAKKASEQDTQRAILAAIKMQEQLRLYNSLLKNEEGFQDLELGLRIGINTGLVSVGKVGESREGDFTVYGPQVNLASRMESNAPVNRIMMPVQTKQLVEHIFDFEHQGLVSVKGVDEPIDCWLVISQKVEKQKQKQNAFIGREDQLKALDDKLKEAEDCLRIVGIKGDAGIGKSRFIAEFINRHPEAMVLKGACSAIAPSPFNLFTRIIENYFGINHNQQSEHKKEILIRAMDELASASKNKEAIRDSLPLIALLMEIKIEDERIKQKGKDLMNHLIGAVETVLFAIIKQEALKGKPLIMIEDDIHLIDSASAQLQEFLLAKLKKTKIPLLIIAAYRLDYQIIPCLVKDKNFREMEILALSDDELYQMLKQYTAGMDLKRETIKLVRELSQGNPFYLEEWSNYVGSISKQDLEAHPIPANLHSLILSRLDSLPKDLRLILHKASVIGNEFFVDILKEVDRRLSDQTNVDNCLTDLEEHSLIMKALGFDYNSYYFKNSTTREVAYHTLLHQNRKMLHLLTAEAIESIFATELDGFIYVLAEHYDKAEEGEKALIWLKKAFVKAYEIYDNPMAIKVGKRLINYLDKEEKADIMIKLADILFITGDWAEAEGLMDEAASLLNPLKLLYCELYRLKGMLAFYRGEFAEALKNFEAGLELAIDRDGDLQRCMALNNLGIWYQHHKEHEMALKMHEESLNLARDLGDSQRQAKTLSNMGLIYLELNDTERAVELFNESLELSRKHQYLRDESIALGNLGWAYYLKDELDEAEKWLLIKAELADRMCDKPELIKAYANLGNVYFQRGDYPASLSWYEKTLTLKEEIGNKRDIEITLEAIRKVKEKL